MDNHKAAMDSLARLFQQYGRQGDLHIGSLRTSSDQDEAVHETFGCSCGALCVYTWTGLPPREVVCGHCGLRWFMGAVRCHVDTCITTYADNPDDPCQTEIPCRVCGVRLSTVSQRFSERSGTNFSVASYVDPDDPDPESDLLWSTPCIGCGVAMPYRGDPSNIECPSCNVSWATTRIQCQSCRRVTLYCPIRGTESIICRMCSAVINNPNRFPRCSETYVEPADLRSLRDIFPGVFPTSSPSGYVCRECDAPVEGRLVICDTCGYNPHYKITDPRNPEQIAEYRRRRRVIDNYAHFEAKRIGQ